LSFADQGCGQKPGAGEDDEQAEESKDQARMRVGLIQNRLPGTVVLRRHDSIRRTWPVLHM